MSLTHKIQINSGEVFAQRFPILRKVGTGSSGEVFACHSSLVSSEVIALKVLYPELSRDKALRTRLKNELAITSGLNNPYVIRSLEHISDSGFEAITMEFLDGHELADELDQLDEPMPLPGAIGILTMIASGLSAIHSTGVVHRDLKPENIILTSDGGLKIIDFGIAHVQGSNRITEKDLVMGSVDYLSPEYLMDSTVSFQSDIYAFGMIAYEIIAGRLPIYSQGMFARITERLSKPLPDLSEQRNECSPQLAAIVTRALEKDPEQRYSSIEDVLHDLGELAPVKIEKSTGPVEASAGSDLTSGLTCWPEYNMQAGLPRPLPGW